MVSKWGMCAQSCVSVPCPGTWLCLLLQEQYIFIHQCVQLLWMKKRQQLCISDVIYENVSKS